MNKKIKIKKELIGEPNDLNPEATLHESEARFRNLMEYIPGVSIQGYRCDGTVVYWNKASEDVYGYTAREAIGKDLGDLIIPPDLKPLFRKSLEEGKKVRESGEFMPPGELMLLHRDGHPVPVYSIHTAVCAEGAEPMLFCIDVDLSERRQAEEELRESEEKFRMVVENAAEGILLLGPKGVILEINPRALEISGFQREEVVGKNFREFLPSLKINIAGIASAFKDILLGKGLLNREWTFTNNRGRKVVIRAHSSLVREGGKIRAIAVVFEEITGFKQAEENLRRRDAILGAISLGAERFLEGAPWKGNVPEFIAGLGAAADVSRVYIFENHPGEDGQLLTSQRYEWCADGIEPQAGRPNMENIPWRGAGMERWEEELSRSKVISGSVRGFPESEQNILVPQDIISILAVPIFTGNRWWGFIGFDECRREREWEPGEVDALKTAAGFLGAAIERLGVNEERLRVGRAIERAKREWEKTFDTIPDLIAIIDENHRIVRANQAMAERLGVPVDELPGATCYRAVHGLEEPPDFCPHAKLLRDGREHTAEVYLDFPGGAGHFLVTTTPSRDREGRLTGSVHVARDISAVKEAREESRFQSMILDQVSDHITITDLEGNIIYVNKAGSQIFHRSPDELIGKPTSIYGEDPERGATQEEILDTTLKNGSWEGEVCNRDSEGNIMIMELRTWLVTDDKNEPKCLCGIAHDITLRKKQEEDLEKHRDHLEEEIEERTGELRRTIGLMAGREARMAELKEVIGRLRRQIEKAGMTPAADDPLKDTSNQ